ncbi:TPA: Cag pathogenicity island protein Cag12, partial [Klebsiella pneumoniae]
MIKKLKVIMLAAIVTGCSSPPPPVPVEWDKAADPLNTSLPQWSDNNVIVGFAPIFPDTCYHL